MKNNKTLNILLVICFSILLLYYGKNFFIPLVLAIFIWFIIREVRRLLCTISVVRKYIPDWLQTLLAGILLLTAIYGSINIIISNIDELSANAAKYDANLILLGEKISEKYPIDINNSVQSITDNINFSTVFSATFSTLTGILSSLLITIIYVIFLLMEEKSFLHKMDALYPDPIKRAHAEKIIKNINTSIGKYISIKTFTSLLTGVLSYTALAFLHIDGAPFWAFIIFIMNYIPSIGSLIATALPTLFAMVQYGDPQLAIKVLVTVTIVQLIVGNGIEPRLMGNTLNLSPLVVLLALALWGAIWGVIGMLLSVPITVIMVIAFSEIPETRPIAIMLSEDGKI